MERRDDKIRVLQLMSSLSMGGAEKLMVDLLKYSAHMESGIEFKVVVMNDIVDPYLKNKLLSICPGVVFLSRQEGHKHPKYLLELLKIVKENKIDIIHTHSYGSKSWAILCKLLNPGLKTVHTMHNVFLFDKVSKREIFMHKKFVDINIAISNAVLKKAHEAGIWSSVLIYNGIDVKKFAAFRKQPDRRKRSLNIVNVSRLNISIKGQDILIRALGECKKKGVEFKCSFIGGGYEYDRESPDYLKNLVRELELQDQISFLGNRDDIHTLLPEYDLFVLPSRTEGLGLAILEAMAAGLPVLASTTEGPMELITHGENGMLFQSENHMDLAEKILEFYNDRRKTLDMANAACNYVKDFDISNMCKGYHELYKALKRGNRK